MKREHNYSVNLVWTGNTGKGTSDYRSYTRDHEINVPGKPPISGSVRSKISRRSRSIQSGGTVGRQRFRAVTCSGTFTSAPTPESLSCRTKIER